ncbi:Uncharacterised protein [Mycobacteroides abscessus subsp. abscessus]|nr:Uncharacterised protein [Mycobacteroides abscessus subsp. abscessus]
MPEMEATLMVHITSSMSPTAQLPSWFCSGPAINGGMAPPNTPATLNATPVPL